MKKQISIIVLLCIFFLSSCQFFMKPYGFVFDMFTLIENFCFALSNEDFELAKTYLSPDSPLNDNLIEIIADLEQENGIDFSDGVAFFHRGGVSGSPWNYDGSKHILEYNLVIGKAPICLSFEMLTTKDGFGIYNVEKYIPD